MNDGSQSKSKAAKLGLFVLTSSTNWARLSKSQFSARSLSDAHSVTSHWMQRDQISLFEFAESTGVLSEPAGTEKSVFIDNIGHSGAAMYDLSVLEHKTEQCLLEVHDNISGSRAEFGNVAAYTYALLGAKLILAHLGLFYVRSRGKNFVFDFFPQFGDRGNKKRYQQAKRTLSNPIKIVFAGSRDVTHADVWELLTALARKKDLTECGYLDNWLRKFDYSREALLRNKILYDSAFWPLKSIAEPSHGDAENLIKFLRQVLQNGQNGPFADYFLSVRCFQVLRVAGEF